MWTAYELYRWATDLACDKWRAKIDAVTPPAASANEVFVQDSDSEDSPEAPSEEALPDFATLIQSVLGADPAASIAQLLGGATANLASMSYEGLSGGGAVRLTLNGERRLTSITINPEVLQAEDAPGMLEDLIVAAFSDAFEQATAGKSSALGGLSKLLGDG